MHNVFKGPCAGVTEFYRLPARHRRTRSVRTRPPARASDLNRDKIQDRHGAARSRPFVPTPNPLEGPMPPRTVAGCHLGCWRVLLFTPPARMVGEAASAGLYIGFRPVWANGQLTARCVPRRSGRSNEDGDPGRPRWSGAGTSGRLSGTIGITFSSSEGGAIAFLRARFSKARPTEARR